MLNHEETRIGPKRIAKIKPFINKYNWDGINFIIRKGDWKKSGKNNLTIALNLLYDKKGKNIPCLYFKT